jgi:hypothetical protein
MFQLYRSYRGGEKGGKLEFFVQKPGFQKKVEFFRLKSGSLNADFDTFTLVLVEDHQVIISSHLNRLLN